MKDALCLIFQPQAKIPCYTKMRFRKIAFKRENSSTSDRAFCVLLQYITIVLDKMFKSVYSFFMFRLLQFLCSCLRRNKDMNKK